ILKRRGVARYNESDILSSIPSKPIKIITGFRRAGKSFLAQRIAKQLVENGKYKIENILYLNFEDYQLSDVNSAKKLGDVYAVFLSDIAKTGPKLIFLDEIQNVSGWDKFVRTIYEKEDDIEIILTGSNSELLSAELGSNLAGRFIEFFLFPFDFKEFLSYKNIFIRDENDYLRNKAELEKLFAEYLNYGGLPEIFEISSEDAKFSYLKGIITKVVLDDIVKRFNVDNVDVLERLLNYVLSNVGGAVSYTNLKNKIKQLGLEVKVETVIKYVSYFAKTFVVFELNKFDWKQRKVFSSSKKYFATDVGLTSLFRPSRENLSMKLENLIFLHLKKKNGNIFYGANERGREVDFILRRDDIYYDKYQVCSGLDKDNLARELGVFNLSDKYLKGGDNFILTSKADIEPEVLKKYHVNHYNIIRWLLEKPQGRLK
ncbi:MAG: ATP-binding protein, partial [Deltaproteobacteria bacterium]|nr:ATP-binding protein [Deltaproteobacteria bacterium]